MNIYDNAIPIVFAANDYFIPYTAATIQSIMENADAGKKYHFFILHTDITASTAAALSAHVGKYPHFCIDIIDVSPYIAGYDFFTANRPDLTKEAYFRLLIPELLSTYDKVIYLDGDMICRSDISELYAIDLGDNLVGAARDIAGINRFIRDGKDSAKEYWDVKSHTQNVTDYYCDGMVIFNNRQFRKTISTTELFNLAVSRKWKCHDQDILNYITNEKTFFLPYTWNFIQAENTDYLPEGLKKEYAEAEGSIKIIHFAGVREKPWIIPVYVKYFEYFWMYAVRTPFINTIINRMQENHLINGLSYQDFVLDEIKHRNGGLRFILKCLQAWLQRK